MLDQETERAPATQTQSLSSTTETGSDESATVAATNFNPTGVSTDDAATSAAFGHLTDCDTAPTDQGHAPPTLKVVSPVDGARYPISDPPVYSMNLTSMPNSDVKTTVITRDGSGKETGRRALQSKTGDDGRGLAFWPADKLPAGPASFDIWSNNGFGPSPMQSIHITIVGDQPPAPDLGF
jgi:hypothetical protein